MNCRQVYFGTFSTVELELNEGGTLSLITPHRRHCFISFKRVEHTLFVIMHTVDMNSHYQVETFLLNIPMKLNVHDKMSNVKGFSDGCLE